VPFPVLTFVLGQRHFITDRVGNSRASFRER
jgi:hypothetical protein